MKAVSNKKLISLENIESIEIVRSFSQTYQLEQYQPISAFASYKAVLKANITNEIIDLISSELQAKAEDDVFNQIDKYKQTQPAF